MKKILLSAFMLVTALVANAQEAGVWYSLRSGTKALIIENGSMENGAKMVLWTPTNVPSQLWQFEKNDDGTYCIHGGYQDEYMCTKVTPNIGGVLSARTKGSKTRLGTWILEPVEGKADTYYIYAKEKIGLLSASESADGIQPTLVDPANPTGKTEWKLVKYTDEVSTEYDEHARDAIVNGFMNYYYKSASSGHVLGEGGWWGDAEMFETLLDGFETTGDKTYQTWITQLITNFTSRNGNDWTRTGQGWPRYNEYNDDITWMVLALIRSYKYFKVASHLTYAKNNFDKMWERAIQPGGTLRWKESNDTKYGSNSCINCPAIIAACYLYEMTGEEGYLDKAKSLWDAQYKYLCDQNDGHVWDSGSWDTNYTKFTVGNYWGSTYNQGTMLGACCKLWQITGESKYKAYATKVYNWSFNSLTANTNAQPRIINACQTADGDLCGFKGILVRYVRMYAEMFNKEDALQWLEKNAWYAYQNANSKGVIWSKWLTKTSENFKSQEGNDTKDFSNHPFGCSTAVSCAVNAHVNRVFKKDAFSTIEAQMLDDVQWLQIYGTMSDGDTPNTTSAAEGAWICFKNVDFGTGADGVDLRVKGIESTNWTVYLDKINEANKLASSGALTSDWTDVILPLGKTITGIHNVYVRNDGDGKGMFHTLTFLSDIAGVDNVEVAPKADNNVYNISGQRVSDNYKGIVIKNGRKYINR